MPTNSLFEPFHRAMRTWSRADLCGMFADRATQSGPRLHARDHVVALLTARLEWVASSAGVHAECTDHAVRMGRTSASMAEDAVANPLHGRKLRVVELARQRLCDAQVDASGEPGHECGTTSEIRQSLRLELRQRSLHCRRHCQSERAPQPAPLWRRLQPQNRCQVPASGCCSTPGRDQSQPPAGKAACSRDHCAALNATA